MLDIHALLARLGDRRPVFYSEADFQHAFAWELHQAQPEAEVRLERPVQSSLGALHVDLVVESEGDTAALELKYKTRALAVAIEG